MKITAKTENNFAIRFNESFGFWVFVKWDIERLFQKPNCYWHWKTYKHITLTGLGFLIRVEN